MNLRFVIINTHYTRQLIGSSAHFVMRRIRVQSLSSSSVTVTV